MTQWSNLLIKDVNIGGVLLSVEGSKPVGISSDCLQKKFDPIVYSTPVNIKICVTTGSLQDDQTLS